MRKNKRMKKALPFVVVVALLLTLLPGMTLTAHGQDQVAPAGAAPYTFSIDIPVTVTERFNGVMVYCMIEEGADQLQWYNVAEEPMPMRFVRSTSLPTGSTTYYARTPYSGGDVWTCGFMYMVAENPVTSLSLTVGRVEFTYIGTEPVKIVFGNYEDGNIIDIVRVVDFESVFDRNNTERTPQSAPITEVNVIRAPGPDGFVAVDDIVGVPTTATVGTSRSLSPTIIPENATNKDIIWTVKNAGATGATVSDGRLYTTGAGTAVLTATIVDGWGTGYDFIKDFTISVTAAPYAAVSDITGVPTTTQALTQLTLTGTVQPSYATYQDITWELVDKGTTSATLSGNVLSTYAAGTVTVQATIPKGVNNALGDFTKLFTITVTPPPPPFVPVTGIVGVPAAATSGSLLALGGVVMPEDATRQNILWSVKDAGTTGAYLSGTSGSLFNSTAAGYATVTATIKDGKGDGVDYVQDFVITVNGGGGSFVPVTNITGVPSAATAGTPLTLTGTVEPTNATNKTITWSLKDAGTTGATLSGSTLNATAAGNVIVTATIVNGINGGNYVKDFVIAVSGGTVQPPVFVPVTGIAGVPTEATAGTPEPLTGTVNPADATNKSIKWTVRDAGVTGATIEEGSNMLKTTAAGTVVVTATISKGLGEDDFTSDFSITVNPAPFVPVTGIADVPDMAGVGMELELTGKVVPSNATYQDILWSAVDEGDIDFSVVDGVLVANGVGTVKVTAKIVGGGVGGADYTEEFEISVGYTVTFDLAGGTKTNDIALVQVVLPGESATAPSVTRSDFKFVGWDKEFTELNLEEHITVKAVWEETTGGGTTTDGGKTR
ncbi:MAG: hypothetical protein FWG53_05835, partial [Clostridiales bacterium]|nr:hypothetical protein [Clostridiales bacterium]